MINVMHYPVLVFALTFIGLWATEWIGALFRKWRRHSVEDLREDFNLILAATLTLLALIIGFSFSMAITRYDQRKNLEAEEANAIGTEYASNPPFELVLKWLFF